MEHTCLHRIGVVLRFLRRAHGREQFKSSKAKKRKKKENEDEEFLGGVSNEGLEDEWSKRGECNYNILRSKKQFRVNEIPGMPLGSH